MCFLVSAGAAARQYEPLIITVHIGIVFSINKSTKHVLHRLSSILASIWRCTSLRQQQQHKTTAMMKAVCICVVASVLLLILVERSQEGQLAVESEDNATSSFRNNLRRRTSVVTRYWNIGTSGGNSDTDVNVGPSPVSPPPSPPSHPPSLASNEGVTVVYTRYWDAGSPADSTPTSPPESGSEAIATSPPTISPTSELDSGCEEVELESTVLVGMIGRPDQVTVLEQEVLEQAFADAYNNADCGDRVIDQVGIVTDPNVVGSRQRQLQASLNSRDFTYIFRASGRCRGCRRNSRLFGEGVSGRRKLGSNDNTKSLDNADVMKLLHKMNLNSESAEDESCPCEAPTEEDFLLSFNATIARLLADRDLANVVGVNDNISELEQLDCPADQTDFETVVSASFNGDQDTEPSQAELTVLAAAFVDSYNEANGLNGNTCDLLFRVASEADLIIVDQESRNRELQSNGLYNYLVRVRGSCRGCRRRARLFGESQGRKLSQRTTNSFPEFMTNGNRWLQTSAEACFCPVESPELRAPSEDEFEATYNDLIQFQRAEGEVTTITSVTEVRDRGNTRAPTSAPTLPSSQSPTSSPAGNPLGRSGSSNGDPHLVTFDGLRYDCQSIGEFTMFKTLSGPSFEAQVRYGGNPDDRRVSVGKGYAIVSDGDPTIQLSIPVDESASNGSQLGSCPILFYVDGMPLDLSPEFSLGHPGVSVQVSDREVILTWLSSGISLAIRSWTSGFFGCALSAIAFIPETFSDNSEIVGLLGSPNGNFTDDWTDTDGSVLPVPMDQSQRLYETAYLYCTRNWCIRDALDSFFTYEDGSSFEDFNECDAPFESGVNLGDASESLTDLCGTNEQCLIDGIIGGTNDAQNVLEEQAAASETSQLSRFRFSPSTIQTGFSYNIAITADFSDDKESSSDIDFFQIYRLDPNYMQIGNVPVVGLQDIGSGIGEDTVSGDSIFSSIIALRSDVPGEMFGFWAVPVINGTEEPTSQFVLSSLNAVQSYSIQSGLGDTGGEQNQNSTITEDSITDLVLVITYSWPADQPDLDTGTSFLDTKVGFACGSGNEYISFSGDDTTFGGRETTKILLGASFSDNQWDSEVTISMATGWFSNRGSGPASVSINTEKVVANVTVASEALSIVVDPGAQSGCATFEVGEVVVMVDDTVSIMLIPL